MQTETINGNREANADKVLVADAILSQRGNTPGYKNPGNNYGAMIESGQRLPGIPGGFMVNNKTYPHVSPHLSGSLPSGGDVGFKDGHAQWRKFNAMIPRTKPGDVPVFWW